MNSEELRRLKEIDLRVQEIAKEEGLLVREVLFEIVPAQRVLEGQAYWFPTNFSHWSFGRDYEKQRTLYEHTGQGIPYEQVWDFDPPRAFLVETNPFVLNVMVLAHVYGHVDFFSGSKYRQRFRSVMDVAEEARQAAKRFAEYEERFGKEEVENLIDSAMSIMWHQHPDPFHEEEEEEVARERIFALERAKLERDKSVQSEFAQPISKEEITKREKRLAMLAVATPPEPVYDLLYYIANHSGRIRRPWQKDVLLTIRNQVRALAPNRRIKMLNEGWATYWHVRIMRRLFAEGLLSAKEHEIYNIYHSGVAAQAHNNFNVYRTGLALYEYVEERWNKGQFGPEYEQSEDPYKRLHWDTGAMKGREKIFEMRTSWSDRMAVEALFTDDFIHEQGLYSYTQDEDPKTGKLVWVVEDDDPKKIRDMLKDTFATYQIPIIFVQNGNARSQHELLLGHTPTGFKLDPEYRNKTLEKLYHLWGKTVSVRTVEKGKYVIFSYDGKEHKPSNSK